MSIKCCSPADRVVEMFDQSEGRSRVLDELLSRPRIRLTEMGSAVGKDPGFYALFYRRQRNGPLPIELYPYGLVDMATYPLYLGCAADLRCRIGEHRRNAEPVESLNGGADLLVARVPVSQYADCVWAEQALVEMLLPLWNMPWLAGWGSRWQGRSRASQTPPPWSVLQPGRRVGCGVVQVSAAELAVRAEAHLAATATLRLWAPLR